MILVNDVPLEVSYFPNGELQVKEPDLGAGFPSSITVRWYYQGRSDEMVLLGTLADWMRSKHRNSATILDVPYFPYSRMDRETGGQLMTLRYVCEAINRMKFDVVRIYDPHSSVTPALLERVEVVEPQRWVDRAVACMGLGLGDLFVLPDAGALNRLYASPNGAEVLVGNKHRDPETGAITGSTLTTLKGVTLGENARKGQRALIVDDICVKGGTFIPLIEKLRHAGVIEVGLYVTHLERDFYLGQIWERADHIFTTTSLWPDVDETNLRKAWSKVTFFSL